MGRNVPKIGIGGRLTTPPLPHHRTCSPSARPSYCPCRISTWYSRCPHILFKTAAETLLTIAADPDHLGARIGITLPVRVLSRLFRRLCLEQLVAAHDAGGLQFFSNYAALADRKAFVKYLAPLRYTEWVVYAKKPFGGPEQALRYVSRYTHRVAVANRRLTSRVLELEKFFRLQTVIRLCRPLQCTALSARQSCARQFFGNCPVRVDSRFCRAHRYKDKSRRRDSHSTLEERTEPARPFDRRSPRLASSTS
jgi:hypothetical protein